MDGAAADNALSADSEPLKSRYKYLLLLSLFEAEAEEAEAEVAADNGLTPSKHTFTTSCMPALFGCTLATATSA